MNIRQFTRRHKHAVTLIASAFAVLMLVLIYGLVQQASQTETKRLVTFYDRGRQHVVLTKATTVQEAIQASDIKVNPQDVLEPERATRLKKTHEDVIIYRSRMVSVIDGKIHQNEVTVAQSPNAILKEMRLRPLSPNDKVSFKQGDLTIDGPSVVLVVERVKQSKKTKSNRVVFKPLPNALTAAKGAQIFVDSQGVAHRETYYDLPMNIVIQACGPNGKYTIRSDGAKIDQDGYVLVAANLNSYPRCSVVETSLGPGKVYDTGGFAVHHPYGFDLATDWSNFNGL